MDHSKEVRRKERWVGVGYEEKRKMGRGGMVGSYKDGKWWDGRKLQRWVVVVGW